MSTESQSEFWIDTEQAAVHDRALLLAEREGITYLDAADQVSKARGEEVDSGLTELRDAIQAFADASGDTYEATLATVLRALRKRVTR